MSITVIMPVFNGEDYLGIAIESILNQSFRNFEFLIIDDASTDKSTEIVTKYLEKDERIKYVKHNDNVGLARSLNEGIMLASHDLIARMDQDDESLPNRLQVQLDFMKYNEDICVAGSFVYHMGIDLNHDKLVKLPAEFDEIKKTLLDRNCIYHPSVIFRKKCILSSGGYREQFKNAEDYDLWLRVAKKYKIVNIPQPLLRYRLSIDGMSLGSKWEQLYYANLAKLCAISGIDPSSASLQMKTEMSNISKTDFLKGVYSGTISELYLLGHSLSGLKLALRSFIDCGPLYCFYLFFFRSRNVILKLLLRICRAR